MIRVVLDWESAYGKHPLTGENVTLSKLTGEEYVRHPLFKAHGLGVKIGTDKAFYLYKRDDLLHFLRTHPWDKTYAIAHHAQFDMAILAWRCGVVPAFIGDTLSMGRAIFPNESVSLSRLARLLQVGEKGTELANFQGKWTLTDAEQQVLGAYCRNDVELTSDIFDALKKHFPIDELKLIDWTIKAFAEPVLVVDRAPLLQAYKAERRRKRALLKECATDQAELASNDKFASLLITLGVDPPKKLSPSKVKDGRVDPDEAGEPPMGLLPSFKAPKGATVEDRIALKATKDTYPWAYAFGKSDELFKMLLDHPDPQVQAVVEARMGVKSTIKETRSKRFYKIGTRGRFPVYLNYYGGHTGRFSGGDKQNAQNLNRVDPKDITAGALRMSLCAPEGHVVVVRDLGQIEARVLVYWAGQEDMLDMFRQGGDPYNFMATKVYGREVDRKHNPADKNPGQVGKIVVLGAGYQMGAWKLQENIRVGFMGMPGFLFDKTYVEQLGVNVDQFMYQKAYRPGFQFAYELAEACKPLNVSLEDHLQHCAVTKHLIDTFRRENPQVVALWKECQAGLNLVLAGAEAQLGERGLVFTCPEGLTLPNGMKIRYSGLRLSSDGKEYKYLANARKKEWTKIYAGKIVENCIAEGTDVLTDRGWVPIEKIRKTDLVHDGLDFVPHSGVVFKSVQACVCLDGVYLTPDHEVLTDEGWKQAGIALAESRLYRPDLRSVENTTSRALGWEKALLGVPMRLRQHCGESRNRRNERDKARRNPKLWLFDPRTYFQGESQTRYVKAPCLCCVAVNVGPLPTTHAPSMAQLWRAGDKGLRAMGRVFRKLLGRYGTDLSNRFNLGSRRQRRAVLSGELQMGISGNTRQQHKAQSTNQHSERSNVPGASSKIIRNGEDDVVLPDKERVAGGQIVRDSGRDESPVYDIMDCGPLQRFVVRGKWGPFIVHNCVQALSRIILTDQKLRIINNLRGYRLQTGEVAKVVSSTHDEIISVVPYRYAEQCLEMMNVEMRTPPPWCADLPLKSSGGYAVSYGECEK